MANPITRQHVAGGAVGVALSAVLMLAATTIGPFEGLALKPYVDTVGTGHPETWCYGETKADGTPPPYSKVFTPDECKQILAESLPKYDDEIKGCLTPAAYAALPPHRHAAILSLVYNIGGGAFCKSSILRDLNAGRTDMACNDFLGYNRANGRVLAGLVTRRKAESAMCKRTD